MYGASSYDVSGNAVASILTKTLGLHSHWGLSSAFDFVEAFSGYIYSFNTFCLIVELTYYN